MRKSEKRRLGLEKREQMLRAEKELGLAALVADRTRRAEQGTSMPLIPTKSTGKRRGIKASAVENGNRINVRR
jgi:hypothetical protein